MPTINCFTMPAWRLREPSRSITVACSADRTAKRMVKLAAKLQTSPKLAVIKPPNMGPMKRAPFITVEFKAMALVNSCRLGKSFEIKACLAGASNALPSPSTTLPATTCHASM